MKHNPWLVLFLGSAAVGQVVRLVTEDTILDGARAWWSRKLPDKLVTLLGCPWCLSAWVAAIVTVVLACMGLTPLPVLWWLATWRLGILWFFLAESLAYWGSEPVQEVALVEPEGDDG